MNKYVFWFITSVLVLGLVLVAVIGAKDLLNQETRQKKCTSLSGVYISGQCFKAELIKLEE